MTAHILDHPLASLMALLGMLCMIGWPLARTRRSMLLIQIGIGVGFGLHYALLGVSTAAAVNALGAVQIMIALRFGERADRRWLGRVMILAVVGAAFLTWQGAPTLAAAAGTLLIALGRDQSDAFRMRVFVLAGYPFWVLHDWIVGSPVIIADVASLVVGAVMLMRAAAPTTTLAPYRQLIVSVRFHFAGRRQGAESARRLVVQDTATTSTQHRCRAEAFVTRERQEDRSLSGPIGPFHMTDAAPISPPTGHMRPSIDPGVVRAPRSKSISCHSVRTVAKHAQPLD